MTYQVLDYNQSIFRLYGNLCLWNQKQLIQQLQIRHKQLIWIQKEILACLGLAYLCYPTTELFTALPRLENLNQLLIHCTIKIMLGKRLIFVFSLILLIHLMAVTHSSAGLIYRRNNHRYNETPKDNDFKILKKDIIEKKKLDWTERKRAEDLLRRNERTSGRMELWKRK